MAIFLFTLIELGTTQINPYPLIGSQHNAGLDDLIADAPATIAEMVDSIYDYVQNLYYPTPSAETQNEIKAVIYKALNGYENQLIRASANSTVFNKSQQVFIEMMLGGIHQVPVDSIHAFLADVEDNITKSNLSVQEQIPLLLAALTGRYDYEYWINIVESPGDWASYLNANQDINYAEVPYWVAAAMEGALLAATRNDIEDVNENVSIDPAHSLATGIATVAMKIMYNLLPRMQAKTINALLDLADQLDNPENRMAEMEPAKSACGCGTKKCNCHD
jgi:hypothetical protein